MIPNVKPLAPSCDPAELHLTALKPFAHSREDQTSAPGMAREALLTLACLPHPLPDLICFAHIRWNTPFGRPQQLLSRFAAQTRVFFVEEPVLDASGKAYVEVKNEGEQLWIVVFHLPAGLSTGEQEYEMSELLDQMMKERGIIECIAWYYTPIALGYSAHLRPRLTVYDCTDDVSPMKKGLEQLNSREQELLKRAELVFTSGQSLYNAKRNYHRRIYALPNGIDRMHFAQARKSLPDPADQLSVVRPRIGYYGPLDDRINFQLIEAVAQLRPDWQFVFLGSPSAGMADSLPRASNLHYLGIKLYQDLPAYVSNWDAAWLPFELNETTRYISPVQMPEYLAAGKPVVATPITDIVEPYCELGLVNIASSPEEYVSAIERALVQHTDTQWQVQADRFLAKLTWDETWARMSHLLCQELI